jgi:hypothetical protein
MKTNSGLNLDYIKMDMLGEIVEHEIEAPKPPQMTAKTGFPDLNKLKEKKVSKWKQRLESKKVPEVQQSNPVTTEPKSEAEKIHQENLDKISQMTSEEIEQEQAELLSGLDPNLIKSLLKRSEKKEKSNESCCNDGHDEHVHAEGFNGWIGGGRTSDEWADVTLLDEKDVDKALGISRLNLEDDLKIDKQDNEPKDNSKTVRFEDVTTVKYEDLDANVELDPNGWEDVEDVNDLITGNIDEVAHKDYQLVNDSDDENDGSTFHFPKPIQVNTDNEKLDLNDPEFYDKLHEKYYPDLPKETHKLSWMTEPLPKQATTTYESISDMRFDFKGDLVDLTISDSDAKEEIPTYLGLHHHSENPHLPGYTLSELAHLSRSVLAGQRSFSIQILGRILHKLGLHKYNILPVGETEDQEFNENLTELMSNFENLMWDLIEELRIIDSLTEAADESKTRNLSVRNYAIEALWLWKQGGGRKTSGDKTENSEYIASNMAQ